LLGGIGQAQAEEPDPLLGNGLERKTQRELLGKDAQSEWPEKEDTEWTAWKGRANLTAWKTRHRVGSGS
jgi:hypothetical protein